MPSELRSDAKCPECNQALEAVIWTSTAEEVTAKFYHGKNSESPKCRRPPPCNKRMTHLQSDLLRNRLHAKIPDLTGKGLTGFTRCS